MSAPWFRPRENGVALLTVLLLVAVMAVIAATALDRLQLSTRLAANAGSITQARAFALAAEQIATARIEDLVAADPAQTTLVGGWMNTERQLPIPGGTAMARVGDGGNCFNLNSLVKEDRTGRLVSAPFALQQFITLMGQIGIDRDAAYVIAASAADWIDSDQAPIPGGAEDGYYRGLETPYTPPNHLMASPSELRAVNGVSPEYWDKLRPWVCALPVAELSPINVNTLLPEQAPLLAMLIPQANLDTRAAAAYLARRPETGWGSLITFWGDPVLKDLKPRDEATTQTKLKTEWFTLDAMISLGNSEVRERALIDARQAPVRVLWRDWGEDA
ncbi:type II secretion system minor pseudopilin GspK [Novosphingopyxis sp.]|uniref:type II secretion system minor pseudopilin GspK n=1 Tax=Novosphingopyxis sp. TaxID=2709690 RepID=UPI003B5BD630